jgi:type I site-specific restriction-modification system R (restriction) subunit
MSQIEILKALTQRENEKRLERLASQIESLRQAKHQSAEELAVTLEPLAQAMAALVDETRQTLAEIERRSQQQAENFQQQIGRTTTAWIEAAEQADQAAIRLIQAGQRMEWQHYGLTVLTGLITAALVTAFWLWLAPLPKIQNVLDPREVAEWLKPALTGQPPPSSGKQRH